MARIGGGRGGRGNHQHLVDYTRSLGCAIEAAQVQAIVDKLISVNLTARPGHGVDTVADPFVRGVWRKRSELALAFAPALRDDMAKMD